MAKMYENEGCAWSAPRKRRGRNLESLKICWNRGKDACDDDDHDHHGACDDDVCDDDDHDGGLVDAGPTRRVPHEKADK